MADEELVARVRQGDRGAFDVLMDRHAEVLLRIAYGYVKSRTDAEDIVQDTLLAIWQGRAAWDPQGTVISYFVVAVRRRALNLLKHRRVEARHEERVTTEAARDITIGRAPSADAGTLAAEEQTSVWELLDRLPERAKMVLLLRYGQQMSFAEVATAIGISVPAVRQVAKRALDQLRAAYHI